MTCLKSHSKGAWTPFLPAPSDLLLLWSTHDTHDELAAASGRRCSSKRLCPSPCTSRGPSCGASLCAAAGWGGGHRSIKYKMHWPARSLLFVQLGVFLGGWAAGLSGIPTAGPLPATAEGEQGSTQVPEGHETQGHGTMPKPPPLWQKYFIIYIRLQPHSTGQGPEFAILHINTK